MSFNEHWDDLDGNSLKPGSSNIHDLYDIKVHPETDNAPSVSDYRPITLEELSDFEPDFEISPEIESYLAEIDWSDNICDERPCSVELEWWEENARNDLDAPPLLEKHEIKANLEMIRAEVGRLAAYKDVREFAAWLTFAGEKLTLLKLEQRKISHRSASKMKLGDLQNEIDALEEEIAEFENDWGYRERIAELEAKLLNNYVSSVVKAQRRIARQRHKFDLLSNHAPESPGIHVKNSFHRGKHSEFENAPSLDGYVPVTLEELSQYDWENAFMISESDFVEIDWEESFGKYFMLPVRWEVDSWEKKAKNDWALAAQMDERENEANLETLHEACREHLSKYKDVREFAAWLSFATQKLAKLKAEESMLSQLILTETSTLEIRDEIATLEAEIAEFENDWGYRGRIADFESKLLTWYASIVVKAQKRVAKHRLKIAVLGRFGPKPQGKSIRSPYQFEEYCSEWMSFLGAQGCEVSRATQDGGVDIISEHFVAQVKLYNGPIPVSQVRDLLGTALDVARKPLFFASMGYSKGSIEFAERNGIALFVVDAYAGEISGANDLGEDFVMNGLRHQ